MCKSEYKYSSDLQIVFGISSSGFDQQVPTFDNHYCFHNDIILFLPLLSWFLFYTVKEL